MNTTRQLLSISAVTVLLAGSAFGATYNDATNDLLPTTAGFPHLNVASVEVNNTATDISFKFTLVGDPIALNWGEYQIGIDSIADAGSTGTNVPNGRPITMSTNMDYYIRSWDSGAETYHWEALGGYWFGDNFTWNPPSAILVPVKTTNSVTLTTTLASLGLSAGNSFYFDAYTSGGTATDSAVDALANPNATVASGDWVTPYSSGANVYQYTVTSGAIPIAPILSHPQKVGTTFTVSVPTEAGFNYVLEFKSLLSDATWTAVQTNSGTGARITMTNTAVAGPNRYYQVSVH